MKNTDNNKDLKRTDIFKIDPKSVNIDWSTNPRTDYGTDEEWAEFKGSIKAEGVRSAILVYWDADINKYSLAHGFRRMKASLELIQEGVDIQFVQCQKVKNNKEDILFDHFTMNKGKELNDLEKSETFKRLTKLGYDSKTISERTGVSIAKVYTLLKFASEATLELKETVKAKKTTFSTAVNIVRSSKGNPSKQTELLTNSLANTKNGTIKLKDVTPLKKDQSYKKLIALQELLSGDAKRTISILLEHLDGDMDKDETVRKLYAHVASILD